jgi:hypothetical protein
VSLFVWLLPLDLSGLGGPTSSYATAGIALRVSGALKPHHHDKVEITSVILLNRHSTISPCSFITAAGCSIALITQHSITISGFTAVPALVWSQSREATTATATATATATGSGYFFLGI